MAALYRALAEADANPAAAGELARMIQDARKRQHPPGVEDIRRAVELEGSQFSVDLGDRLGVDFFYGLYRELPEALAFLEALPPQGRLMDVGANFGFFTVRGAQRVGAGGAVLALEPHPRARFLLKENVAANRVGGIVTVSEVGAAEENGWREFHFAAESAFSGLADTRRARIAKIRRIAVRTLDSLAEEHSWDHAHGIKIDVEGFEYAVLEGAQALLSRSVDVLVLLEASPKNLKQGRQGRLDLALAKCRERGLEPWWIDWRAAQLRPLATMAAGLKKAGGNLFLVRKDSSGWERLVAAIKDVAARLALSAPAAVEPQPLAVWIRKAMATRNVRSRVPVAAEAASAESAVQGAVIKRLEARLLALEGESQERLALYRKAEGKSEQLQREAEQAELKARRAEHEAGELRQLLEKAQAELVKRRESLKDLTARWTQSQKEASARKLAGEKAELEARRAKHDADELRQLLEKAQEELATRFESLADLTNRWTQSQAECDARGEALRDLKAKLSEVVRELGSGRLQIAELERRLCAVLREAKGASIHPATRDREADGSPEKSQASGAHHGRGAPDGTGGEI